MHLLLQIFKLLIADVEKLLFLAIGKTELLQLFLHLMQLRACSLRFLAGLLQLVGAALHLLLQSGHLSDDVSRELQR